MADFIEKLDLKDIMLVGHALGGCVSLLTVSNAAISNRVSALVLLNSAGMFIKLPDFVAEYLSAAGGKLFAI